MKTLLLALAGPVAVILAAAVDAPRTPQRQASYEELFDSLWKAVGENFYDPSFRGLNWDKLGQKYRPRARSAKNDAEFQRISAEMLAELKSSHVDLPPRSAGAQGTSIGAKITSIDGKSVVNEVSPLSDARRKGLREGDILLSGAKTLLGPVGSVATLQVEDCEGRVRNMEITREGAFWPVQQPSFRWSTIRKGPRQNVGYLRVDGFGDDGAPLSDRAMADLNDSDALIIDVRHNPGGNASALRLASYFTQGAQPGLGLLMRNWLARLGRPAAPADVIGAPKLVGAYTTKAVFSGLEQGGGAAMLWTEDLGEKRWTKPVVLLLGEGTGSAAEGFAWLMKLKTSAILIGRDTAGALLGSEVKDIGSGWSVRVPVHGIWAPDGQDYGDKLVPPDQKVRWTRADYCSGRDPDLEAAFLRLFPTP